jgi:xanthine dehydrogenase small subunit
MLEENAPLTRQGVKDGLTGNLCRCTGYEQIIDAALALKGKSVTPITERYHDPQMYAELEACAQNSVEISYRESWGHESRNVRIGLPTTLAEAVAFKAQHEKTVVVSGGTDISVQMNKGKTEPETLLSLVHLQELEGVSENDGWLKIGAKATWTDMERACGESLPEFRKIIQVFASAQIKNVGTLAGNVGNGSPIADSMPFLFVMDAEVELTGSSGSRWVNINHFYHGYKQLELRPDELITALRLQLPKSNETLKLYKVSKRKDLDISTFTAGIRMALEGATISQASVAYGGVGPVVLRLPETEQFLSGKPLTLETVRKAGKLARREIIPISDVRASKDYRLQLAENILLKFYHEVRQEQSWLQPDTLSA